MKIKLIGGCLDQKQRNFPREIENCASITHPMDGTFFEYKWLNTGLFDESDNLLFFYIGYTGEFVE